MKKIFIRCFLCCVIMMGSCLSFYGCADNVKKIESLLDFVLEVEDEREVVILQLTDIQIIDADQRRTPDRLSPWAITAWASDKKKDVAFKYMREIVEKVKPDLIVLTGDNMYGEFDDNGSVLTELIAEMESYDIPWTLTYGNHDNESIKGVAWQNEQFINAKNCIFKKGNDVAEGNGNFTIGIKQGKKIVQTLYMLDSHGCDASDSEAQVYSSAGFMDGQLEWVEATGKKISEYNKGNIESLAFFHHPLRGYGAAMQLYGYTSPKHSFYDTNGDWLSFRKVSIPENINGNSGDMNEDAGQYIDGEYEFVEIFKCIGGTGVFFGHDHKNYVSVYNDGLRYTYGLKSSKYDSYLEDKIGGTKISIGQKLAVDFVFCEQL